MKWAAAALLALSAVRAGAPPVSINLQTSWGAPPILLEILETVYDEQPSAYFPFLSLLSTHLPSFAGLSDQAVLTRSLDLLESHRILSTPSALSTLQYALGLHTTSPRIEAQYSWYNSTVDEAALGVETCETWVQWKGKGFCDVETLRAGIERGIEDGTVHAEESIKTLQIDHVSAGLTDIAPQAAIYLDPSSSSSVPLLEYLERHARAYDAFRYIVRYKPSLAHRDGHAKRVPLSGYGVELALKKTDYLVVDDRAAPVKKVSGEGDVGVKYRNTQAGPFDETLGTDPWSELSKPLRPTEIADVHVKAAAFIASTPNPLEALLHISQDFPKYSAALARNVNITDAVQNRIDYMERRGQVDAAIYVNGKSVMAEEITAFSLLKNIREERELILSLTSLGFTPRQAFELISDSLIGDAQTQPDPGEGTYDASDRLEGEDVIIWWNDITKDSRYSQWPSAIGSLLRPLYPGQLHTIRQNLWNVILVLDLSQGTAIETIANAFSTMIQRGVPIRFGLVPMFDTTEDDLGRQMARLVTYSVDAFGRAQTKSLLAEIAAKTPSTPEKAGTVNLHVAQAAYERIAAASGKAHLPFEEVINQVEDEEQLAKYKQYTSRLLATRQESPHGHVFVNGKYAPFTLQWTGHVQQELTTQLQYLQEQLAVGIMPKNISTFFYDLPNVPPRRSKLVVPNAKHKLRILNVMQLFEMDPETLEGKLATEFIYSEDHTRGAPVTMWVIGDLDSEEGRRQVKDNLRHLLTEHCSSRLGFVHIPTPGNPSTQRLSTLLYHLYTVSGLHTTSPSQLLSLVEELDQPSDNLDADWKAWGDSACVSPGSPLHAFTSAGWEYADVAAAARFWQAGTDVAEKLGVTGNDVHLLANGRLVGPVSESSLPYEDLDILELYEHSKRVRPIIDLISTMFNDLSVFNRATFGNLISRASSVLASAYKPAEAEGIFDPVHLSRNRLYEKLDNGELSFTVGDRENALVHIAAILDPVSTSAQQWSGLLTAIAKLDHVAISVYMEPEPHVQELKLKRFHRTSLDSVPLFDVDGQSIAPPLLFTDLPSEPIYTLGMDTPPSWITRPVASPYDLDNLLLSNVHEPVQVDFQLKQLVVEGHAREGGNAPPRGLQLQLSDIATPTSGGQVASDTLVMANLGYFQFKVTPGVYDLSIRPGRGEEVYELQSTGTGGWDSKLVNETGTSITLASFDGVTILPRFGRRKGMEMANVLDEARVQSQQDEGYMQKVFSKVKSAVGLTVEETKAVVEVKKHADINIFTVASGLLYERFASIMILSVMKHTHSTVKFWFIENFLSPSFIAFLPHLAEEYGFEYELVTYKWPHWLRAQTEKQRIIWAYKILFLDVLFPQDLDKVIFVDADQIVRTDMKELIDVDLQGRVYGYAPMGNSREEMEGFRFWKTGYWKEALRGRPYHISALYVVDLKRFRQLATGDRLRGQYHALSADPNSLANLDQDLPNSMQDQIPIFTLDQDWLWCQSWCSDESLATAKTIDLCQNPMTKEPKLVRARQIPEWDSYDQEVARLAARVAQEGGQGLAGSVDDLAGEKPSSEALKTVERQQDEVEIGDTRHLDDEL